MNVLLLSCSTGGGHNSAAAALQSCLEARGHTAALCNVLEFLPPSAAEFITKGHDFSYRHLPRLYGVGYRYEERHPPVALYRQIVKGAPRLGGRIEALRPDAVVCVHVFAAMMVTELRRRGELRLPAGFLATDYTCSPGVGQLDADRFFIPHEALLEEFTAAGVPSERILSTGIPVRPEFTPPPNRADLRRRLGMERGRLLLMTGGSMGCGPIPQIAGLLAPRLGPDDRLLLICGSNRSMHRKLSAVFRRSKKVVVLGYTKEMALLMRAADLFITKAGGLSTAEAVATETPLLYINAVPGCESRNLQFMKSHGYAAAGAHAWDVARQALSLLEDGAAREAMVARRRGAFPLCAAETISSAMEALCGGEERETQVPSDH